MQNKKETEEGINYSAKNVLSFYKETYYKKKISLCINLSKAY